MTDVLIIGAGIAGASLAHELAADCAVTLIEREEFPGLHSTGRSAALFTESYGNDVIRRLTVDSREYLSSPPAGFAGNPILGKRGALYLGRLDQAAALDALAGAVRAQGISVDFLSAREVLDLVPLLRADYVGGGVFERGAMDIDVNELHQGFLRGARARGAKMHTSSEALEAERAGEIWRVRAGEAEFQASVVVDAAGAWADEVAGLFGAQPVGLQPMRRTAAVFDPPPGVAVEAWPTVIDVDETFYFKPDAGRILASPADETPSPPCDAQPDDMDVAIGIDRVMSALDVDVRRVVRSWAGLRVFAPDRTPVVGWDPAAPGFFWLAGQGGYGIQTSPALARLAAAMIGGRASSLPSSLSAAEAARMSPGRFAGRRP